MLLLQFKRNEELEKMADILEKIFLALLALVLIYFPVAYRLVDRVRVHGEICVRQMSDDLLRWIEKAGELVALNENDAEAWKKYTDLTEQYRKTPKRKANEKIRIANEIYEVVRMAAAQNYGDEHAKAICSELLDIYADFSMLASDYNENAHQINAQLDRGFSKIYRKMFRLQPVPFLEDLMDLKHYCGIGKENTIQ